ncbi:MAG: hypothetical protein K0Q79_3254 [Flavipsychrobacter sp.]|jgi:hypothetical protein|nr:hypothetical protein [Flavipsychrobacter sp.]
MKNALLLVLFILTVLPVAYAQNIVPNYSFEQADSCPVKLNTNTYKYSLGCVGWGQATTATSDYYNACDTAALSIGRLHPIAGILHNTWGYQYANIGSAYTGICMYYASLPFYKEYLIATIPPLQKDTRSP